MSSLSNPDSLLPSKELSQEAKSSDTSRDETSPFAVALSALWRLVSQALHSVLLVWSPWCLLCSLHNNPVAIWGNFTVDRPFNVLHGSFFRGVFVYSCGRLGFRLHFLQNLHWRTDEGDMGVYSIAVLGFFSCGISVILILTCGISVSSPCGMRYFIILADGIRGNMIVHGTVVCTFLSIQSQAAQAHCVSLKWPWI